MAAGIEFEMTGLAELENDLKKAIKKAPAQAEETLLEIAKDFKKDAKKIAEKKIRKHTKREGDDKKKAIQRKWGHKLVDENLGATVMVWNSAKHFHLIEDGHNVIVNGKNIGFAEGKHIMQDARNKYKDIVPGRFEDMVDDILRGSGLN